MSSGMSEGLEIPEAPHTQGKHKRINSKWINPFSFPTTMGKPGTQVLNAPALTHLGIMAHTSDDSVACECLFSAICAVTHAKAEAEAEEDRRADDGGIEINLDDEYKG
ncbi:hypothetical protein C8J57DRAFT_1241003 [Mycena rebaudengoi]|nr:hypothetical protein C8J57DRAFT_1241003 [Mycena rebaudengoi]